MSECRHLQHPWKRLRWSGPGLGQGEGQSPGLLVVSVLTEKNQPLPSLPLSPYSTFTLEPPAVSCGAPDQLTPGTTQLTAHSSFPPGRSAPQTPRHAQEMAPAAFMLFSDAPFPPATSKDAALTA